MVKHSETVAEPVAADEFAEVPPPYSESRRIVQVFFGRKLAAIGFALVVALVLTAIFAPWLAPHNPYSIDITQRLQHPSSEHLLGTDTLGRDTLSRVIYGTRISLLVGIGTVGLAAVIGMSLGLIAAYFGGITFAIIMRLIDALMAIPMILSALMVTAVLGGGLKNVIVALSLGLIPIHCRLMSGQVLSIKQNYYVLAGRAMGGTDLRTMLLHILPNAFPPLLVVMTIDLGMVILMEASLSFLGLGITPPTPAWGGMVSDGYLYLLTNPELSLAPGFAIMLTIFGFNMMGDGLRDAIDPRLRGAFN